MIKRDFSKSTSAYFKENKWPLIVVGAFILVGVLIALIFGMNGNFELKGYQEFSVTVSDSNSKHYADYTKEIRQIVNNHGGDYDAYSIAGEGDNTKLVIRYMKDLSSDVEQEINVEIAEKLEISATNISGHIAVDKIVKPADYVYTASAILLLLVGVSIFAGVRYNGASCVAIILGCLIGTLGYLSLGSILRLSIGMSYFAMLVVLNSLICLFSIELFETMRKSSWLQHKDYATAMDKALTKKKFGYCFVSIAIMVFGMLFVVFAPSNLKYVALNVLFLPVVAFATTLYVVPFVWNILIPKCRLSKVQITVEDKTNKTEE